FRASRWHGLPSRAARLRDRTQRQVCQRMEQGALSSTSRTQLDASSRLQQAEHRRTRGVLRVLRTDRCARAPGRCAVLLLASGRSGAAAVRQREGMPVSSPALRNACVAALACTFAGAPALAQQDGAELTVRLESGADEWHSRDAVIRLTPSRPLEAHE